VRNWTIPNSWKWASLADVAADIPNAIVDGPFGSNLKNSDYVETGIPVLQGKNITDDQFKWIEIRYISEAKAQELRRSSVRPGDFLIVKIGSIGFCAPIPNLNGHEFAIIPANLAKITLDASRTHPQFFQHWMRTQEVKDHLKGVASQTAQPALSLSKIREIPIPLPPLDEQRRIAAIFDLADDLRCKRREALALLQSANRFIFLEMFGDPIANNLTWPTVRLGDVGTLDRGVSKHRPRNDPALLGGPYPLIQTGEVTNSDGYIRNFTSTYSELGLRQSRLWPQGTLCITIAANIGKTGILTFEACFPDSVVGFVPGDQVRTEFVQQWFAFIQPVLERDAPQFAQKNINLAILRELRLINPPFDLQCSFADRVAEIDKLKTNHRAHLAKLDALFASLQHRAFRGEL
jgi:type I restriction enzyme S subunit